MSIYQDEGGTGIGTFVDSTHYQEVQDNQQADLSMRLNMAQATSNPLVALNYGAFFAQPTEEFRKSKNLGVEAGNPAFDQMGYQYRDEYITTEQRTILKDAGVTLNPDTNTYNPDEVTVKATEHFREENSWQGIDFSKLFGDLFGGLFKGLLPIFLIGGAILIVLLLVARK